ncbi:UDP-N-acetylglucosamine transferase subunit alg14 [Lachnellula suecica]|uniref:UDP-N-acetylglucosamine transferase subunit ALG14 n=1 Tax=Lachnellula suecica TaxID=602035 RepID=A0A8T9CFE0_9HELO|nr:UDP-N-acetylglucosamine transferase subunit alg14 [Lachnellula suecica]
MAAISALRLLVAAIVVVGTTALWIQLRLSYILPAIWGRHKNPALEHPRTTPAHMVVVLGSGGHTAEMKSLMRGIDPRKYKRRTYIISSGDDFSSSKAFEIEKTLQARFSEGTPTISEGEEDPKVGSWEIKVVPRARKIHQPLYTTIFSSAWCLIGCFRVLIEAARESTVAPGEYPDIIITNGPATAVIVVLASMVLKYCGVAPVWKMNSVYVESWARIKTLSLSGKVLLNLGFCDQFIVQWEILAQAINGKSRWKQVEWHGFLVE